MTGLFVYYSNHLEVLSRSLAGFLAEPVANPLEPGVVMVHSKGMGQWLAMELARWNGICANVDFPFPNAFLDRLLDVSCPNPQPFSPYDPEVLTLTIMGLLPSCLKEEGFEPVARYLTEPDPIKLWSLSEKIAGTFDQYLVFRPEMIETWEKGLEDHWQARFWRKLRSEIRGLHKAERRRVLFERIKTDPSAFKSLPDRVYLFGISYLPVFHLEVLAALSKIREVHLFSMNPCREYWGDVISPGERTRRQKDSQVFGDPLNHFETGNPLLSSLGTLGRDFFNRILDMDGQLIELYDEVTDNCLLGALQSDLLNLRTREPDRTGEPPYGEDRSIQIHSCHGRLREVEVLHDNLLALFEADPLLSPGDIFVMAPDIEPYAPFIQAVFGGDRHPGIPFHVSDRTRLVESPLIRGVLSLLQLAGSRFGVSEVLAILEFPGVKEAFELRDQDLSVIEKWVEETGIRWGVDGNSRETLGLPVQEQNTWRAGFQRLLLGYAMPGENRRFFSGILPYDDVEGEDALVLGCFLTFFESLVQLAEDLKTGRTLEDWAVFLKDLLGRFFSTGDDLEGDRTYLLRIFDQLAFHAGISGYLEALEAPVVQKILEQRILSGDSVRGFLTGNVTFCTLLPFRSVPAKVVCLLGMNSDAFPRNPPSPGFDLVAKYPRPGDRILRNDDKYLFLQALVSARQVFYLSFVGQSNRDNTQIPPSVLVQELLSTLVEGFGLPEERLITRHRLAPFSEGYFLEGSGLFSYSMEDYHASMAARALEAGKADPGTFIDQPLPEPDRDLLSLDLGSLGFFFNNPAKSLLESRLGVFLEEDATVLEEDEPFVPDALDQYALGRDLVNGLEKGETLEHLKEVARATGRLPHGAPGDAVLDEAGGEALVFMEQIGVLENGLPPESLTLHLTLGDFVLSGVVGPVHGTTHLYPIYAKSKAKYLLRAWVNHLALHAMTHQDHTTLLVFRDKIQTLSPVVDGLGILESLLSLYRQGLRLPLAFFPETSMAYAKARLKDGKSEEEALGSALKSWLGNEYSPGEAESENVYTRLCFPQPAFEETLKTGVFQQTALTVFGPLFGFLRD